MRLGLNIGYSASAIGDVMPLIEHADRVGIDSVWAAEAYGSDAVTVLDRKSTRLNSSHVVTSRMPSSA